MAVVRRVPSPVRWLITIMVCVAAFAALAMFKFNEIKAATDGAKAQPEHSETVETAVPVPVEFKPTIKALGVALAPQQVTLRNELAGYITSVNARSGAVVQKGQLIVQLDISEQQANLASAQARSRLAQLVLKRDLDLQKTQYVSQDKVDRSHADVDVVNAEIAGINSVINRRTIRAPFAGVIGIHQFEAGQYLSANTVITTVIGNSEQMWVDFSVPQFYGELAADSLVQVRIVRAGAPDAGNPLTGKVIAGNSTITTAARSRLYRAVITERAKELLDNMSVEVEVPLGKSNSLMAVPATAIQSDAAGEYVFVLDKDAAGYRARRQTLTSFGQQGELIYVDGIKATDLVATAGAFKLYPGLLVKTNTRSATSTAGGQQ